MCLLLVRGDDNTLLNNVRVVSTRVIAISFMKYDNSVGGELNYKGF